MKTTLIGSIPADNNVKQFLHNIFESVNIPSWPQLPKRSFLEQMHIQYSEKFPGVSVDKENQKIFLSKEKFYEELESYYEKLINNEFDFFYISKDYSVGFYEFIDYIKEKNIKNMPFKIQTIGPITYGLTIKDEKGQAIYYDEQLKEIINKHIVMKSIWQIKKILENTNITPTEIIIFYDEPYLAAYGSAFSAVSKEEIMQTLNIVIDETKQIFKSIYPNFFLKIGVHCCANTDWSILTSLKNLDIISFDSYDFFETFILYFEEIKNFLNENKTIAWGIVPNSDKIFSETIETIKNKLNAQINIFIKKGVNEKNVKKNLIVTPQCGLGNTTRDLAIIILNYIKEISKTNYE